MCIRDSYNLYRMDVKYDYSIDDVINYGITDNQSMKMCIRDRVWALSAC